ncbi:MULTISPECIES: type II toxin-antitoxin system HicB family antitoxin [unclassified Pseudomonas]|jgi:antitoxin HicB|uniref:type II toxin-antitoxin system HicB family antitoxin n=1 Tax=unclassified Pseudomonas TaxID=196821 RepID=UPI000D42D253|nr:MULTISPECIES: type II toxin-antitoxin system HicB family antitoxin [unclassified Pseudomonas]PTS96457.1 HicB family protein [Pseudomonas sp. HMWF006]PTT70876.1 HicB family protein [Pseudomonas sp. HMWF007]PTT90799.1 HicB family protein [Pseudomonas sp. HMWF005]
MFAYALDVHKEPGSFWLSCAEIPEMHAAGDTLEEAYESALDSIETALSIYVDDRRAIPTGGEAKGEFVLRLPALTASKVALWNTLLESGVSKAELARRLDVNRPQVDRLVDFLHHSKIENVERALQELGRRISLSVEKVEKVVAA